MALNATIAMRSCYARMLIVRRFPLEKIVIVVSMLGALFLVGRAMPGRRWPVVIAATLAVVLLVVLAEQNGYWPSSWRVR